MENVKSVKRKKSTPKLFQNPMVLALPSMFLILHYKIFHSPTWSFEKVVKNRGEQY